MMRLVITIVMPAYNEAGRIGSVLERLPSLLLGERLHVVVVDDGSTDATADRARDHGASVIRLSRNSGKGAAMKVGLEAATEAYPSAVVFMDTDGQHDPADLRSVVEPVVTDRADMVVGSRYMVDGSRCNTPRNRYAVRCMVRGMLRRILHIPVTDPFSGYRCLSPEAASAMEFFGDHYETELEMAFEAARLDLRVAEVPIRRIYGAGMSKMGARLGPALGRLSVISQYASAILRGTARLVTQRGRPALERAA